MHGEKLRKLENQKKKKKALEEEKEFCGFTICEGILGKKKTKDILIGYFYFCYVIIGQFIWTICEEIFEKAKKGKCHPPRIYLPDILISKFEKCITHQYL